MVRPVWLAYGACAVVLALGTGFDWPTTERLVVSELTQSSSVRERRDALRRLASLHTTSATDAVAQLMRDADPALRLDALEALLESSHRADALELALRDELPALRVRALSAVAAERTPVSELQRLRAARDPAPAVRVQALSSLATVQGPAPLAALARGLDDGDAEVRLAALLALGARGGEEAWKLLAGALAAPLPEQRAAAVDALGSFEGERVARLLTLALDDADDGVVLAALRAARRNGAQLSEPRLRALVARSGRVGVAAQATLPKRELPPTAQAPRWLAWLEQSADRRLQASDQVRLLARLERELPADAPLAGDALLAWLARAPEPLRPRIAALTERASANLDAGILIAAWDQRSPAARAAVTRLARGVHDRRLGPWLQARLDDPSREVAEAAAYALAFQLDGAQVRSLLVRLARARGATLVLRILAEGLGRAVPLDAFTSASSCRALRPFVVGPDDERAQLALAALGSLRSPCAFLVLQQAVADRRPLRRVAALRASSFETDVRGQRLRRAARADPEPRVVATAIVAQTLAGDPLELGVLRTLVDDGPWPVGPAAAFAIASRAMSDVAAPTRALVCELSGHPEPSARHNAAVALRALAPRASMPCEPPPLDPLMVGLLTRPMRTPYYAPPSTRASSRERGFVLADGRFLIATLDLDGRARFADIVIVGELSPFLLSSAP